MSELKRSDNDFHFSKSSRASHPAAPAVDAGAVTMPGIAESQPRQTLEIQRAAALWKAAREQSTDPYNSVGAHAIGPQSTRTRAA